MIYRRLFNVPTWGFRTPFQELERMRQQMDSLFGQLSDSDYTRFSAGVFPAINLTEDKDSYYVRAELPGVKAADLDIQATSKGISITGERRLAVEGDNVRYHRRERDSGSFSRIIGLPGDIDADKVDAKLENGILTVSVPKAEAAKPKQIAVK
jgi:HSP20 family protein